MAQRRRPIQTTEQQSEYANNERGVSFAGGVMQVRGQEQRPARVQQWRSSNGLTIYTTVEWHDPVTGAKRTSCNCNGWTMKRPGKPRQCAHTLDMEGVKPCRKERVNQLQEITSEDQVTEVTSAYQEGRELRNIMID